MDWKPGDTYERWGIGWAGPRSPVTVGGRSWSMALLPSWLSVGQASPYAVPDSGPFAGTQLEHGFEFWVPFESELAAHVFVTADSANGYLRWAYPRSRRELEEWGPPGPAHVTRVAGHGHRFVQPATWDTEVEMWAPLVKTVSWTLGSRFHPELEGPVEFGAMIEDWSRLGRWRPGDGREGKMVGRAE